MSERESQPMSIMGNAFNPVIKEHLEGVYSATIPIAGMVWIETGEGAVLVDTLLNVASAKKVVDKIKEKIKYIIYTHGHADHVGGASVFIEDNPKILASIYLPDRFERYEVLEPYRNLIAAMQFNIPVNAFGKGLKDYMYPTETFIGDYTFELGNKTFECHSHAGGNLKVFEKFILRFLPQFIPHLMRGRNDKL